MQPLLYLVHRIPYPPNKGDKIRSFNLLRHLAERYRVFLGCFVDQPEDRDHVDALSQWCEQSCVVPLDPRWARLRSLAGLAGGEALTLPYYRSEQMRRWVDDVTLQHGIRKAVVFSSPMAQYLQAKEDVHTVIDLVDVDSAKWDAYAEERRWPLSWLYRREGRKLLDFERQAAARSAAAVLVTSAEAALFQRLAPECSARTFAIENGVDSTFFAPDESMPSPYPEGIAPLVFTGVMDYWPNIDAVTWFAREVLPAVREACPRARLYVVGMNPAPAVLALAHDAAVVVTGRVADVRPYLQHAAVVVAPLRVARGVQNKVLEAMAMAKPVIASSAAAQGVSAAAGRHFEVAASAADFAAKVLAAIDGAPASTMGAAARAHVVERYSWQRSLHLFDALIAGTPAPSAVG